MAGFKTEDKRLAFRVKTTFAESRNYVARTQCNRKVSTNFYCVHLNDVLELLEFDLLFGFLFFGSQLCIQRIYGINQGSPVSPGIADMVLCVIEQKNYSIMIFESEKWLTFIIRWVDDIWFALVFFMRQCLSDRSKAKVLSSFQISCGKRLCEIEDVYKNNGLGTKSEDASVFAGVSVSWGEGTFYLKQRFPAAQFMDRKYQSGWSYSPASRKLGMMIGLFVGILDRCSHQNLIVGNCLELVCCLVGCGFGLRAFRAAFKKLCDAHPKLGSIFMKLQQVISGFNLQNSDALFMG